MNGRVSVFHVKRRLKIMILLSAALSACATASVSKKPQPWPEKVAKTCPERSIPLECFRKQSIRKAMWTLLDRFKQCHQTHSVDLMVRLKIETKAGRPTCVEPTPKNSLLAACTANAVARHLRLPKSPQNERCQIRYPLRFEVVPVLKGPRK